MNEENLGYFTEDNSADVVIARIAESTDPRLAKVISAITRHIHAAVKEIEPTQEEWFQAIQFLTQTGHKSDDWRQEFILLAISWAFLC
jgi:catechol 1,2-dioxygenase